MYPLLIHTYFLSKALTTNISLSYKPLNNLLSSTLDWSILTIVVFNQYWTITSICIHTTILASPRNMFYLHPIWIRNHSVLLKPKSRRIQQSLNQAHATTKYGSLYLLLAYPRPAYRRAKDEDEIYVVGFAFFCFYPHLIYVIRFGLFAFTMSELSLQFIHIFLFLNSYFSILITCWSRERTLILYTN